MKACSLTATDGDGDENTLSFFLTISANLMLSFGDASVEYAEARDRIPFPHLRRRLWLIRLTIAKDVKTKARVHSELGLYFLGPTPWPPS